MTYGIIAFFAGLLALYIIFNLLKLKQINNEQEKRKNKIY